MSIKLRNFKKRELKVLSKALKVFGCFKLNFILKVKENNKKEVIAMSTHLLNFIEKYKNLNYVFVGIKVGEIGKRFRLTLEGTFLLYKRNRKKVYVNEKGEMLFLYGRDLFSESVVSFTNDINENDVVFVCNKDGDILGIGKARFNSEKIKNVESNRVVVDNLIDRGEYLRKNKLYDAF